MKQPLNTKEDFIRFLESLIADVKENGATWENNTLESYLTAMLGWIEDMDGYYKNNHLPVPDHVDWSVLADMMRAGKIYE